MKYFHFLFILFYSAVVLGASTKNPTKKSRSGCDLQNFLGQNGEVTFYTFQSKLISLIESSDKEATADQISYPLNYFGKRDITIKNKKDFVINYEQVITEELKLVIKSQKVDDLFCQSQGIMFGRGEVWVNNFNKTKKLKIITINTNLAGRKKVGL